MKLSFTLEHPQKTLSGSVSAYTRDSHVVLWGLNVNLMKPRVTWEERTLIELPILD